MVRTGAGSPPIGARVVPRADPVPVAPPAPGSSGLGSLLVVRCAALRGRFGGAGLWVPNVTRRQ